MTCPDCGSDEPSDTCCVWAKANAYDDLKEECLSLEMLAEERWSRIRELEEEVSSLNSYIYSLQDQIDATDY